MAQQLADTRAMDNDQDLASAFDPAELAQEFEIGVCDASYRVYARIVMRGADGVRRIESDLADMGYESVSIGTSGQMQGFDLLVVRKPQQPVVTLQ
jgi:hypothetical protein